MHSHILLLLSISLLVRCWAIAWHCHWIWGITSALKNLIKDRNSWLDSMFHGFCFQEVQNWNICWKWFKQILSELINFYFHWSNPICRSSPRKLDAFKSSQSVYTVEITQKIFIQRNQLSRKILNSSLYIFLGNRMVGSCKWNITCL